ncbi:MAG: hypothetical protein ACUVSQ_02225 [Pseudanabaenaceae cyanobacterium]
MLWGLLGLNGAFFVLEVLTGWQARSLSLVADGLDMLADALIYGLALAAIGRSPQFQNQTARLCGGLQLLLSLLIVGGPGNGSRPDNCPKYGPWALWGSWRCWGMCWQWCCSPATAKEQCTCGPRGFFPATMCWRTWAPSAPASSVLPCNLPDLVVGFAIGLLVAHGSWEIWRLAR